MVERKVIIDKIVGFANAKLSELSSTNPVVLIARPYIARVINNNIAKFDSLLKLAQDDNGMVDIEGIINEMHNIMTMFVYTKIGFLILQKNNLMKK